MKISVAICTWNRAKLLDQTLHSLADMHVPDEFDWELVVVDNNSTDPGVQTVLQKWSTRLPLSVVIEKEQGHSASRNCAIKNVSGDFLIWTDNDVIVSKNWLKDYHSAFRKHPDAGYFGGPITPVFENEKPDWISDTWDICAPVYATRELGDFEFRLDANQLPYGANFAIRTDLQRKFIYDTKWGRKKNQMLGEDEVAVLRKVIDAGEEGFWVPAAKLQHFIPLDRATSKYVAAYYRGQGLANVIKGKQVRSRKQIQRDAFWSLWSYRYARLFSKPIVWVSKLVHANICLGELDGLDANLDNRENPTPG